MKYSKMLMHFIASHKLAFAVFSILLTTVLYPIDVFYSDESYFNYYSYDVESDDEVFLVDNSTPPKKVRKIQKVPLLSMALSKYTKDESNVLKPLNSPIYIKFSSIPEKDNIYSVTVSKNLRDHLFNDKLRGRKVVIEISDEKIAAERPKSEPITFSNDRVFWTGVDMLGNEVQITVSKHSIVIERRKSNEIELIRRNKKKEYVFSTIPLELDISQEEEASSSRSKLTIMDGKLKCEPRKVKTSIEKPINISILHDKRLLPVIEDHKWTKFLKELFMNSDIDVEISVKNVELDLKKISHSDLKKAESDLFKNTRMASSFERKKSIEGIENLLNTNTIYKNIRKQEVDYAIYLTSFSQSSCGVASSITGIDDARFYAIIDGESDHCFTDGSLLSHELSHLFGIRHQLERVPDKYSGGTHAWNMKLADGGKVITVGTVGASNVNYRLPFFSDFKKKCENKLFTIGSLSVSNARNKIIKTIKNHSAETKSSWDPYIRLKNKSRTCRSILKNKEILCQKPKEEYWFEFESNEFKEYELKYTNSKKRQSLDNMISHLSESKSGDFIILGFADSKGDEAANIALSYKRAKRVLNLLDERLEIPNLELNICVLGDTYACGSKEVPCDYDRRVEVWPVSTFEETQ